MNSQPSTSTPGWLVDELSYAGRESLDADHAARYDSKEDASASNEVELLKGIGLTPDALVVEFGAGTGQFTVAVAPSCARVIAVDVSEPMLNQLRANISRLGLDNVEIVQAGFLTYEHVGDAADVVYSRFALHHLPDFWKAVALTRLRGMLRIDGVLRLWDVVFHFAPAKAEDRIEAWCATAATRLRRSGLADSTLTAFVKSGKRELTRISGKIKSFYYYEMRAEDG